MLEIAVKTFKHGRWELRSCFLGVALCVAEMFTFLAINNNLFSQTTNSLFKLAALGDILRFYFTFTAVTVLGIYYSLKSYFDRRVKDYRVMFLLGAKSSSVLCLVVIEYLLGSLIAVVEGLLLGNAAFFAVRYYMIKTSNEAIWNKYYVGNSYKLVILLSLLVVLIVAFIFIMKYSLADIGNKLMQSDGCNDSERIPATRSQFLRAGAGALLIVFSVFSLKYLIVDVQYLILPYISISVGLTMVIHTIACRLIQTKPNADAHLFRKLRLLPLIEKYRTQFNRIVIIVAIDIFAMGYVAVVISDFIPVRTETFPYNAMIMTNNESVDKVENLIKQNSGTSYVYPMVRITDWYNYEHIGVSEDVYRELGGQCEELSSGEVVISRQNQHVLEPVNYDAEKSEEQYEQDHYFYPGKYRYDHGWDDLFPDQSFDHIVTEHKYDIKELKYENLIGQWLVDEGNMAESLVVFSNTEFESIRNGMTEIQDEPTTLMLCRFPKSTMNEALLEIEQNAPELCPEDTTTKGQKNWYTSDSSAAEIMRYRTGGLAEMIILLIVLVLSAAVQLIVNNLSEQTYLERRMVFLDRLGYPGRTLKSILSSQYRIVPYFAIIISVIGSYFMRWGYIMLLRTEGSYYLDAGGRVWLTTVIAYIILRVSTTEIVILIQRSKLMNKWLIETKRF